MSIDATRWAWQITGISVSEKAVLLSYADRAGEDHTAWPGRKRLAKDTGLSERHVVRLVHSLCAKGIMREVGTTAKGMLIYELIGVVGREDWVPQRGVTSCQGVTTRQGRGVIKSGGDDTSSGGDDTMSSKPTTEPNKESINETTTTTQRELEISQFCYDRVKLKYPGYDIGHIISVWKGWVVGQSEMPRDIDAAFLGFAKTFVERNPLPFAARPI